jgi:hypothetical protein
MRAQCRKSRSRQQAADGSDPGQLAGVVWQGIGVWKGWRCAPFFALRSHPNAARAPAAEREHLSGTIAGCLWYHALPCRAQRNSC